MNRPAKGPPTHISSGSDGIAISHDGKRLYYCPLASRRLYSASVDALVNTDLTDDLVARTVADHGEKGGASDGLESDAEGRIYVTNYEQNAILRRLPDGSYETLVHDPRVLWPDTLSLATDGYLYFTANQLHRQARFHQGKDLRERPYSLFRVRVNARPVLLR
jgi:sugar lactone lactonase YvrE